MTLVSMNNAGEFNGSHLVFATLLSMFRYLAHIFLGALQRRFFKSLTCLKEHYKLGQCLICERCDECTSWNRQYLFFEWRGKRKNTFLDDADAQRHGVKNAELFLVVIRPKLFRIPRKLLWLASKAQPLCYNCDPITTLGGLKRLIKCLFIGAVLFRKTSLMLSDQ